MQKTTVWLLMAGLVAGATQLAAQGTAFTYQGRLDNGGEPYTGPAEMQFSLWDAASGGSPLGSTLTLTPIGVTNGLFTVTLDFGAGVFSGPPRWLEIAVRTNLLGFTTLSPRQPVTATPYAIHAADAGTAATATSASSVSANAVGTAGLQDNSVTSAKIADGTITAADVNAASFGTTFWKADGNAGTTPGTHFLGTADNQALEFKVNNQRALRMEPNAANAPNVIGGYAGNYVSSGIVGATIAGGGAGNYFGNAYTNRVVAYFGTVSGGRNNTAGELLGTVGGGEENTASGNSATVSGGAANTASGGFATVSGGAGNTASGWYATIPGGRLNLATDYAFAAGRRAKANHTGTFVWADSQDADFASTGTDQFLIRAAGGVGINADTPGALLQVGTAFTPAGRSEGMIRLASRSAGGGEYRFWDIGVPEGGANTAGKFYSFVIDDPQLGTEPEVVVRWDNGNVGIGLTNPATKLHVNGTVTCTTLVQTSDRNAKENFEPVNALEVLDRVVALPIACWNYKSQSPTIRHIGPTAQDFRAAFGVGESETGISTVDANGVALAAIQGLNQKLEARSQELAARGQEGEARIRKLEAENVALRAELTELRQLVRSLAGQPNGGGQ